MPAEVSRSGQTAWANVEPKRRQCLSLSDGQLSQSGADLPTNLQTNEATERVLGRTDENTHRLLALSRRKRLGGCLWVRPGGA